jgi:hypothetical protein
MSGFEGHDILEGSRMKQNLRAENVTYTASCGDQVKNQRTG